jgi:hypothetical protein
MRWMWSEKLKKPSKNEVFWVVFLKAELGTKSAS